MKTKEAIRSRIIHYMNMLWGIKGSNNFDSLTLLMIEEICNELYLLDNKLNDIDSTILEKLVEDLSPATYNYVRPAHGILQIKPEAPIYFLDKKTEFFLKTLPNHLKSKNITSVVFTPAISTTLWNAGISSFFFNRTFWNVDEMGNKKVVFRTDKKAAYNKMWIKLEAGAETKELKNLFLYVDFPHLNDTHEYYDLLSTVKWSVNGKELKIKPGFPRQQKEVLSRTESDTLDFYDSHYQTIESRIHLDKMQKQIIPDELVDIVDHELLSSLFPGYWLTLSFPPYFAQSDLEKMIITLNAFPVLNRRYNNLRETDWKSTDVISLPSDVGEKFLEMDTVIDSGKNLYYPSSAGPQNKRYYSIEPIYKKSIESPEIYDYLERLVDIIQDERTAFPKIDNDKIMKVMNSIAAIQDNEMQRAELNRLNEHTEVARLKINVTEEISSLNINYWTTHLDLVNNLPEGTALMANKIPVLNKTDAVFLTPADGARSFYDIDSLKAINKYYLTSKDRILTKHDIISFCRIELNKYTEHIDVVKSVKISPKPKEGLINVIEIQITPKEEYVKYLNQKGILKKLKIGLIKRSPGNYNYVINIHEPKSKEEYMINLK